MAANLDELPADCSQRLLIRPKKATVIAFNVAMGVTSLIFAGTTLVMGCDPFATDSFRLPYAP